MHQSKIIKNDKEGGEVPVYDSDIHTNGIEDVIVNVFNTNV